MDGCWTGLGWTGWMDRCPAWSAPVESCRLATVLASNGAGPGPSAPGHPHRADREPCRPRSYGGWNGAGVKLLAGTMLPIGVAGSGGRDAVRQAATVTNPALVTIAENGWASSHQHNAHRIDSIESIRFDYRR